MSLATLFKSLNKGLAKDIVTGLSVSAISAGAMLIAINQLINQFRNATTGMPPTALAFMHLAGIDIGMSILFGAIVAKYTVASTTSAVSKIK